MSSLLPSCSTFRVSEGLLPLLRTRRSIRHYESRPLSAQHCAMLEEVLLRAPSSRGIDPWQFVLVDDPALLAPLSRAKEHGSEFLASAPLGIVVCADERASDVWIEDCSIAATIVHLAAHAAGLGSCWIQIRCRRHDAQQSAEEYIRELLNMPAHIRVEAIVAVGYAAEHKDGHPREKLRGGKIFRNRYGVK